MMPMVVPVISPPPLAGEGRAPASPSPLAGEGRAPASPSPLAGEGRGGGSALRIVEKLRVGNSHHLAAAGAVPRQRIVQAPAVEHSLEMRQTLRVGDVRHGQ